MVLWIITFTSWGRCMAIGWLWFFCCSVCFDYYLLLGSVAKMEQNDTSIILLWANESGDTCYVDDTLYGEEHPKGRRCVHHDQTWCFLLLLSLFLLLLRLFAGNSDLCCYLLICCCQYRELLTIFKEHLCTSNLKWNSPHIERCNVSILKTWWIMLGWFDYHY